MRRFRAYTRTGGRAAIIAGTALAALPALAATAQAHPPARIAIAAPAARTVSGSVSFAVTGVRHTVSKIVFKVDGETQWTATRSPFRFGRTGRLNTRALGNGAHVLLVRAFDANKLVATVRKPIVVHNQAAVIVHAASVPARKRRRPPPVPAPAPTATAATNPLGLIGPPVGGVAGPSPVVFNRVTYNYSSALSVSAEAKTYQVMVLQSTNGALVAALHAANPKLIILMYQHAWVSDASDPTALSRCTSFQDDLANHPDWFLRDQNGNIISQPGWPGDYLMDVGNPAYQQACSVHAASMAKSWGFDGVFFDGIAATLQWELPTGTKVPEYPSLATWQAAMSSWVNYVGPTLHTQGLKTFGNLCGTTMTTGLWQKWAAPLDGAMEESWTDGGQGLTQQISDWPKKLADAAWSAANGKMVLEHSYNGTETANTYGLASLMLVNNGTLSYSTSNINYTYDEASYPEYPKAQSLGAAAGPYVKLSNGVYERPFSKGIVLVNPTASTVPSFSLGGTYSGSQLTNATSVTMKPTSGLILLQVG